MSSQLREKEKRKKEKGYWSQVGRLSSSCFERSTIVYKQYF